MTPFAFVIHPIKPRDVARVYPIARFAPEWLIEQIMRIKKPVVASHVTGIRSITGKELHGWFIGCPLTPKLMMENTELAYDRIAECARLAEAEGAKIMGLGAFTSVVGDGGVTVSKRANIGITTGNSYTVATAIEGTLQACNLVGVEVKNSTLAVVGATGSIGKTCAKVMGRDFGRTIVVGRDMARTEAVACEIGPDVIATTDMKAILEADAIVTVTSSDAEVIMPDHLRRGAVVCDVARPRDVSVRVAKERPDVLVIEGGVVSVPGDVDFGMSFGFPPQTAYACMSETMMLALEDRTDCYTLGKDVSVEQVDQTQAWAKKHGFKLAGFRSFERAVDADAIARARKARGG